MKKWQHLRYVVISRDRLGDLAADAAGGDARAARVLAAILEWDGTAARCINCKVGPLLQPEAFIITLKDDGETWGAGICARCCAAHEGQLVELAQAHLRRAHPSMRIVTPGTA
jgi:hypothetical protein